MARIERWPRHYAADILALKTREERAEKFAEVPEHLRALVKRHIQIVINLRKHHANSGN